MEPGAKQPGIQPRVGKSSSVYPVYLPHKKLRYIAQPRAKPRARTSILLLGHYSIRTIDKPRPAAEQPTSLISSSGHFDAYELFLNSSCHSNPLVLLIMPTRWPLRSKSHATSCQCMPPNVFSFILVIQCLQYQ